MRRLLLLILALFTFAECGAVLNAQSGAGTILETQIRDGSILARVASAETITGAWIFSSAGSTTLHIMTTADTFSPTIRLEGYNRNWYVGTLDVGVDGDLVFSEAGDLSAANMTLSGASGRVGINKTSSIGARLHVVAGSASEVGLIVDTAASTTVAAQQWQYNGTTAAYVTAKSGETRLILDSRSIGNNVGGSNLYVGRNANGGAEGGAAGSIELVEADAGASVLWADATGKLRIHTAAPTGSSGTPTVSDTAGRYFHDSGTDIIVADGGTGVGTFTTNGVIYGNGTGNLLATAQGPANSVLTANAGAPSFSATPTLTSLTTTGDATVGDQLIVSGTGPHAIGGATDASIGLYIRGSFAGAYGTAIGQSVNPPADSVSYGLQIAPSFVEAGSGNHGQMIGTYFGTVGITGGAATVTDAATVYIQSQPSFTVSGGNYALWIDSGQVRIDGPTQATIGANGAASALTANPVGYLEINIGGTGYIVPYYNK